jgi:hypothetical protein
VRAHVRCITQTGECDALGNGDKTKSIALTKTKGRQRGNLSFWSTLKPTIAEQSPLTYKYLVMSGGGEFVRMENLEGYRTLQLDRTQLLHRLIVLDSEYTCRPLTLLVAPARTVPPPSR